MPAVPCVRPSQGSVHAPAKGTACRAFNSRAASATSKPTSQCPVWKPRATGSPLSARRPPCVLRIRNSGSRRRSGSQLMPALLLLPRRFPDGWISSISAESGSSPAGPCACVATLSRLLSAVSSTDEIEMVAMGWAFQTQHREAGYRLFCKLINPNELLAEIDRIGLASWRPLRGAGGLASWRLGAVGHIFISRWVNEAGGRLDQNQSERA